MNGLKLTAEWEKKVAIEDKFSKIKFSSKLFLILFKGKDKMEY